MRSTDVFPSKYLKAEELDEDVQVTIKSVVLEELEQKDGQKQDKPVCYFEEGPKGLILNKTNWALIAKQHGDESDNWPGKTITLTVIDVDAFGDVVSAIRIKPLKKAGLGSAFPKKGPHKATPTDFWTAAKRIKLDRTSAEAILTEVGGDWDKALDAVEQMTPPADETL